MDFVEGALERSEVFLVGALDLELDLELDRETTDSPSMESPRERERVDSPWEWARGRGPIQPPTGAPTTVSPFFRTPVTSCGDPDLIDTETAVLVDASAPYFSAYWPIFSSFGSHVLAGVWALPVADGFGELSASRVRCSAALTLELRLTARSGGVGALRVAVKGVMDGPALPERLCGLFGPVLEGGLGALRVAVNGVIEGPALPERLCGSAIEGLNTDPK